MRGKGPGRLEYIKLPYPTLLFSTWLRHSSMITLIGTEFAPLKRMQKQLLDGFSVRSGQRTPFVCPESSQRRGRDTAEVRLD